MTQSASSSFPRDIISDVIKESEEAPGSWLTSSGLITGYPFSAIIEENIR